MADQVLRPWAAPTLLFLVFVAIVGVFMFTQDDQPHFQATPTETWPEPGTAFTGHWGSSDRHGSLEISSRDGASASLAIVLESGEHLEVEGTLRGTSFTGRVSAPDTPWDDAVVDAEISAQRLTGRFRFGGIDQEFSFRRR